MKVKKDALDKLHSVELNTTASTHELEEARAVYKASKAQHQALVRNMNVAKEVQRDTFFNEILSSQPRQIFKAIKSKKSSQSENIKKLSVGEKLYTDEAVADGFYDSIAELKTLDGITASSYDSLADITATLSRSARMVSRFLGYH